VPGVLRLMLAKRPAATTPLGARDRAMLLLGFGAALRRSELVALTLGDVETVPGRGIKLLARASPHRARPRLDRQRRRPRRPPAVLRRHQDRHGHRHRALRQGGRPTGQAGRRRRRVGS
jgi:integrase